MFNIRSTNERSTIEGKNDFKVSKNLALDTDLKIILLDYQNNYIGRANWLLERQNFLQHCLSYFLKHLIFMIQQNYFQIFVST